MSIKITSLFYYPIKSCAAVATEAAQVARRGLRYDREWMVVTEAGMFLTQREHPEMTQIHPTIEGGNLVVRAEGAGDLIVPLASPGQFGKTATVWKFTGTADDEGDEAAAWFTARLSHACRLLRAGAAWDRPVNPHYADAADRVGFADGYPSLLASEASLADLNRRLTETMSADTVPMDRFRPNLVVTGDDLPAWEEDGWTALRTEGGLSFRVVRTCARCSITTIDQETAEGRGPEPLKTLGAFRRADAGRVLFGVYVIADAEGVLRVGEEITRVPFVTGIKMPV